MKTFIYSGPDVNLGRHGQVSKGDFISVSDAEFEGICGDPRFKEATEEQIKKNADAVLAETRKATAEQAKKDEVARAAFARAQAEENGTVEVPASNAK